MPEANEMNVNLAEKYSSIVDERFKLSSITDAAVNQNYDFDGVSKINVYSVETAELNDYNRRAATNRYGTPKELGNAVQSMTLTQDKSFTFTIDRGNYNDTVMANSAGNALQREIDEVITPMIDKYRLAKLCDAAESIIIDNTFSEGAYEAFLEANLLATEALVPSNGRIAYVSPAFYKSLKLDSQFTGKADKANEIAVSGVIGKVDNVTLILTPSSYLPENVNFVITHPCAILGPVKLAEYKIHDKPQGISGWLCEGRVYFDAFVLKNKKDAIIVSKKTATEQTVEPEQEQVTEEEQVTEQE